MKLPALGQIVQVATLIVLAALVWQNFSAARAPAPSPVMPSTLAERVRTAMVGPDARADAAQLAGYFSVLAEMISAPVTDETRQLETVYELLAAIQVGRAHLLGGRKTAEIYPGMAEVYRQHWASLGSQDEQLTPEKRLMAARLAHELSHALGMVR